MHRRGGMARDFRDLAAWRLAVDLEEKAIALAARPAAARDATFRDQLTDAAGSAPRNIAEGFGRFKHKEFAYFVRIAKGSENETLNQFETAVKKGYLSKREFYDHEHLAKRAMKAAIGLIRYLESTPDPE